MKANHILLPCASREEQEITLLQKKRKCGLQKRGEVAKRKVATNKVRFKMCQVNSMFYLFSVLLRADPKELAQILVDYICLISSLQSNLGLFGLRQTADSTPPQLTPRL